MGTPCSALRDYIRQYHALHLHHEDEEHPTFPHPQNPDVPHTSQMGHHSSRSHTRGTTSQSESSCSAFPPAFDSAVMPEHKRSNENWFPEGFFVNRPFVHHPACSLEQDDARVVLEDVCATAEQQDWYLF